MRTPRSRFRERQRGVCVCVQSKRKRVRNVSKKFERRKVERKRY